MRQNDLLPWSYYKINITLVIIGITGMSDDLTHDKVVVSRPYLFKLGNVKHILS